MEIRCLPSQLPEFIEVDVAAVELDTALHLSDITLPAGVTFAGAKLDDAHDQPIFSVHKAKGSADADTDSTDDASDANNASE